MWELIHFSNPFHIFLYGLCTYVGFDESSEMEMDDKILQGLEEDILIVYIMMRVAYNTQKLFNPNKLEEGGQKNINHNVGVTNGLSQMRDMPTLFNDYFKVYGFHELASLLCPTIHDMPLAQILKGCEWQTHEVDT